VAGAGARQLAAVAGVLAIDVALIAGWISLLTVGYGSDDAAARVLAPSLLLAGGVAVLAVLGMADSPVALAVVATGAAAAGWSSLSLLDVFALEAAPALVMFATPPTLFVAVVAAAAADGTARAVAARRNRMLSARNCVRPARRRSPVASSMRRSGTSRR
jgi:hypothetical protein